MPVALIPYIGVEVAWHQPGNQALNLKDKIKDLLAQLARALLGMSRNRKKFKYAIFTTHPHHPKMEM
jgi:hypothetical protein